MTKLNQKDEREIEEILRIARRFRMHSDNYSSDGEDKAPDRALMFFILRALNDQNDLLSEIKSRFPDR